MKFKWENRYSRLGLTAFCVIAASMLFYFGIFKMNTLIGGINAFMKIIQPVVYGMILAYLLAPVSDFLERDLIMPLFQRKEIRLSKRGSKLIRYISVFLSLFFFGVLIYTVIMMVLPQIMDSVVNITVNFPTFADTIQERLIYLASHTDKLNPSVEKSLEQAIASAEQFFTTDVFPQLQTVLMRLSNGVVDVLAFVKNFLIGTIVSIYIMADKESFIAKGKMVLFAVLPLNRANAVIRMLRLTNCCFSGFISGKLLDSAIIGVLCYIGTTIIGTPYAILVSVIIGVTNVIPFFGPYLGAIPCIFLVMVIDPVQALYLTIFILLLQQFDGNILGPKILGGSTGLSSFMVIFAIVVGGGLFGIAGMIVGVPIFAVIYALIWGAIQKSLHKKELPFEEKAYFNVERIDNLSHEPVITRPEDLRRSASGKGGNEQMSKKYNILEVEEILTEMSNAEYVPFVSIDDVMVEEEVPTKTMIFMDWLKKYALIAYSVIRRYCLILRSLIRENGGRVVDKGRAEMQQMEEQPPRPKRSMKDRFQDFRSTKKEQLGKFFKR